MKNTKYVLELSERIDSIDLEINTLLDQKEMNLIPLENKYKKIFKETAGEKAFAKYLEGNKWEDIIEDQKILRKLNQIQGNFELESIELAIEFEIPVLSRCRERESLISEIQKTYLNLPESHLLGRINA